MYTLLAIAFLVCFWALVFINQKNTDLKQENEVLRKKIKELDMEQKNRIRRQRIYNHDLT